MAIGFAVGALISGVIKLYNNRKRGKPWYSGLAISMLAGGVGGAIAVIPIPGINAWAAAAITGAAGNLVYKLILGQVKSIKDLVVAIGVGATAGILGKAAGDLLTKGVSKYFGSLTRAGQKSFLSHIGRITNRQLTVIRQAFKKGLTPKILTDLVKKYGWDVVVSSVVSSTAAAPF